MESVRGAVDDDVEAAEGEFAHLEGRGGGRVADEKNARFGGSGGDKFRFFGGDAHLRRSVGGVFDERNVAAQGRAVDFDAGDAFLGGGVDEDAPKVEVARPHLEGRAVGVAERRFSGEEGGGA